jgi:hypothetical protein
MPRPQALSPCRVAALCLGAALAAAVPAGAEPLRVQLDNGIDATIYSPEQILAEFTVRRGDDLLLVLGSKAQYRLVTSTDDPAIVNRGDGRFHPMSVPAVVEALRDITLPDAGLQLEVYILPYPRREVLDSSARNGMMLLSPGVHEVRDYAVHFTVAHEVGHLYQYRWLPDEDVAGWAEYARLRGIEDEAVYSSGSAHRNRPHEIFAEDFRFLFAGSRANYSGGIENDALPLPHTVAGLEDFLRNLPGTRSASLPAAELSSSPNPFNPSTSIRVQFRQEPTRERAVLRVFDAQGRQVRNLFDGTPTGRSLNLAWDGRDDAGARASSGVYFARLDYRGDARSTKLLLVK